MEDAIGVLCGYAFLVRRGDEDTFDMHRLVHIATRVWIQKQNVVKETETRAIQHLESIFPRHNKENRPIWREYLPHAQHALRVTQEHQDAERFDLFYRVGYCLYTDRRFKEAVVALEERFRWMKQHRLEDDHDRLSSEHHLANAYLSSRQITQAIKIFEHVVTVRRKTLAENNHDRLASERALASAYLNNRRITQAIKIFEHVITVRRKTLVEEDDFRLSSEHGLAMAYVKDRRVVEAIEILEHVVATDKRSNRTDEYKRWAQDLLAEAYSMLQAEQGPPA